MISDIASKVIAKNRSIIDHDKENKRENKEGKEQSLGNKKNFCNEQFLR